MGLGLPWQSVSSALCFQCKGREFDPGWELESQCHAKQTKKKKRQAQTGTLVGAVKWNDHFGKQSGSS